MADTPLILMGYYNPIYRYGLRRFAEDAEAAGVDGVIVVDLPQFEVGPLAAQCGPARHRHHPAIGPYQHRRKHPGRLRPCLWIRLLHQRHRRYRGTGTRIG